MAKIEIKKYLDQKYLEIKKYLETKNQLKINTQPFKSFHQLPSAIYDTTYPPDGFDEINKKACGKPYSGFESKVLKDYRNHPLTHLSTWLGLPNSPIIDPSWQNIFYNFIGGRFWKINIPFEKKVVMGIRAPFVFTLNLLRIPIKIAVNIAKLGTEFLPLLLSETIFNIRNIVINKIANEVSKRPDHLTFKMLGKSAEILSYVIFSPAYALKFLYFMGRSLTSPLSNVQAAWAWGQKTFGAHATGKIASGIATIIAMLPSLLIYSALLPFITPLAFGYVLPFLAAHLPMPVTYLLYASIQTLTPILSKIGQVVIPYVATFYNCIPGLSSALSPYIGASPISIGLATIATGVINTIGNILYMTSEEFNNWLHKKSDKARKPISVEIEIKQVDDQQNAKPGLNKEKSLDDVEVTAVKDYQPNTPPESDKKVDVAPPNTSETDSTKSVPDADPSSTSCQPTAQTTSGTTQFVNNRLFEEEQKPESQATGIDTAQATSTDDVKEPAPPQQPTPQVIVTTPEDVTILRRSRSGSGSNMTLFPPRNVSNSVASNTPTQTEEDVKVSLKS